MREWLERAREARPIPAKRSAAQIVRELRDAARGSGQHEMRGECFYNVSF